MGYRTISAFLLGMMLLCYPCFATKYFDFFLLVLLFKRIPSWLELKSNVFVFEWPGAYCEATNSGCCLPTTGEPSSGFFVKELLTYTSYGDSVTRYQKINFNYSELASLSHELEKYWANIACPSSNGRSSRRSKWKNSGVCSGFGLKDYFKTGLDLLHKTDVLSHLAKKGIYPDYDIYEVAAIKSAIEEGIDAEPLIRCAKGPRGRFQLFEVLICVDRDGSTVIECPVRPRYTCSEKILFHPYKQWMLSDTTKGVASASAPLIKLPADVQ